MTPFSAFLHSLCQTRQLRQKELAFMLGVDPSYLSALARGRKGRPNEAIVQKLQDALELTDAEQKALQDAARFSQMRFRLPTKAQPRECELFVRMFESLGNLKPAQMDVIDAVLKL